MWPNSRLPLLILSSSLAMTCYSLRVSNPSNNGITIEIAGGASPQAFPSPQRFLLQLDDTTSISRRQTRVPRTVSYVCPRGTCTACQFATIFTLVGEELYADEQLITTSTDAQHELLVESSSTGNVTGGFTLVDGVLQWRNLDFATGTATFCLSTSNSILAVFDAARIPANCIPTNLIFVPCQFSYTKQRNACANALRRVTDTQCFPTISIVIEVGGSPSYQDALQLPGSQGRPYPQTLAGGSSPSSGSPQIGGQYGSQGLPQVAGGLYSGSHSGSYRPQGSESGVESQNAPGIPGLTGASGSTGSEGLGGEDGTDGHDGLGGSDGRDGTDGEDGSNGENGTNGKDGKDGTTGATGPAGPPGPAGPAGTPGVNGTNGINGTNGATGPAGPAGPSGATGAAGRPGANGVNGFNGVNGINGTDGVNGTAGAAGPAGPAGANGTSTAGNGTVYGTAYVHYSYIGCYVANPDGNFGIEPTVAQEVLTTSVEDCATLCADQSGNGTIYFTLGTDSQGNSICTCGNALTSYNYLSVGMDFHCNIPCNFTDATTTTSPVDFCGGQFGQDPLVSVFGAI